MLAFCAAFLMINFTEGLKYISIWALATSALLYSAGALLLLIVRVIEREAMKVILFPPVGVFLLILPLGLLGSGFFDGQNDDFKLGNVLSEALPVIVSVAILIVSSFPLLLALPTFFNRDQWKQGSTEGLMYSKPSPVAIEVDKIRDFMSRENNRLIIVGPCRSGKSSLIEKLVDKKSIFSGKEYVAESPAQNSGKRSVQFPLLEVNKTINEASSFAIDEAQVFSSMNWLGHFLHMGNHSGKPYIICTQHFNSLNKADKAMIFKGANAIKIICCRKGENTADIVDLSFSEISRYQAEMLPV